MLQSKQNESREYCFFDSDKLEKKNITPDSNTLYI